MWGGRFAAAPQCPHRFHISFTCLAACIFSAHFSAHLSYYVQIHNVLLSTTETFPWHLPVAILTHCPRFIAHEALPIRGMPQGFIQAIAGSLGSRRSASFACAFYSKEEKDCARRPCSCPLLFFFVTVLAQLSPCPCLGRFLVVFLVQPCLCSVLGCFVDF